MRLLGRVLLGSILFVGFVFSGSDRPPLSLILPGAQAAPGDSARGNYELGSMRVMAKVLNYVKENYVDPHRVHPKEMMIGALEAVERTVPDVMVEGTAESTNIKVNVGGNVREFDLGKVDSLWKLSYNFKDIFDFISKNMRPIEEPRDVEYAAVSGMLQTLDPHSMLLRPEQYREMKAATKGEFGGMGFMIQMREGILTVMRVFPKTPASRVGIRKDDQIVRIGSESTVNMDVTDAVTRLRGPPDTKVSLTVARKEWGKPQTFLITRALINIESVQHKLLPKEVGYVRLKNFQGNTARDLEMALADLDEQARVAGSPNGIRGLVLDMRGNPGGLLEQALQVSDLFLSSGVIVTTVGYSDKMRDERTAHADDGDDAHPIAILVNAGSASASEIVAGALKNDDRAVIIGRRTFGKGSVQMLYDFPDESALKLTIAKYLTPGDVSIQEVGIVPDIELEPTRVSADRVDVFAPRRTIGEVDLQHHLSNPANAKAATKREEVVQRGKPKFAVSYLKDEPAKKKDDKLPAAIATSQRENDGPPDDGTLDDQLDAETQGEIKEDFEINFARDFLLAAPQIRASAMLNQGAAFVEKSKREQAAKIAGAIAALGVDWEQGPFSKVAKLAASLKPSLSKKIVAGSTVPLEVTVENKGEARLFRVRGWLESDNPLLDRREFLFGSLKAGERKSWSIPLVVPKQLGSRSDIVKVRFQDDSGLLEEEPLGELSFVEIPPPQFTYTWSIVDGCQRCNRDGEVQRGEELTLLVDVTNVGVGKALTTFANIRNASDANVFIERGRFRLGEIAPGETKTARFELQVKKGYRGEDFALRLAVIDEALEEFMTDKLKIPVATGEEQAVALAPTRPVAVRIADKAALYATQNAKRVIAWLPHGAVLSETGRNKDVARVELSSDRFAFAKVSDLRSAKGAKAAPARDLSWASVQVPAKIALNVDPAKGGIVVDRDRFPLAVTIEDKELLDTFVLVNDQKVYYRAHQDGDESVVKFSVEIPLKEGANLVRVVTRNSEDFLNQRAVFIRRSHPAAVAQKLP